MPEYLDFDPFEDSPDPEYLDFDPFEEETDHVEHDRGFVGDTASRLARGAMGLVEGVGGAMRMSDLDPTQEKGMISRAGKAITDWAGESRKKHDFLKPDIAEATGQEGIVKRGFEGAVESMPASMAPLAGGYAGMKLGAAVGTAMAPGPGTVAGAATGAILGAGLTLFGTFGLGEYQNAYDEADEHLRAQGLSDDEIQEKASKHALTTATAEVGGELVGDIAAASFFGVLGKNAAKQGVKQTIKQILGGPAFGKALAKTIPFEAGSEVGTAYFQTKSSQELGMTGMTPQEGMAEAVLPAIFMSLFFGAGIKGIQTVEAQKVYKDLNSDDKATRSEAVLKIASRLDKQDAAEWMKAAKPFVESGEEIPLSEPIVDFAVQAPEQDPDGPIDLVGSGGETVTQKKPGVKKTTAADIIQDVQGAMRMQAPRERIEPMPEPAQTAGPAPQEPAYLHGEGSAFLDQTVGPMPDFAEPDPMADLENVDRGPRVAPNRALQMKPAEIDKAANKAATSPKNNLPEPTEAQIEAGNYKKGKIKFHGLDVSIENPKGSTRKGTSPEGKKWETKLTHHYGYFKRSEGSDGDAVDVFIGPKPESEKVFIVDQVDPLTGDFDEHKILAGFPSLRQARKGYLSNYEKGWEGLGAITEMPVDQFKEWLKGDTTGPVAGGDQVAPGKPVPEPNIPESREQGVVTPGGARVAKAGKRAKPKKPRGKGAQTIRKRIMELGFIRTLNMKGELKEAGREVKMITRVNSGMSYDLVERTLKDEGWMAEGENLIELLRTDGKEFLKRRHLGISIEERKDHLTDKEKQLKAEMEWEPEAPPGGEYVEMNAGDLPEGKKLTIIDGNSADGWDEYEVIEKDPFGVTLKDGTIVELSPLDKVEVRVEDLPAKPSSKDGFIKYAASHGMIGRDALLEWGKQGDLYHKFMAEKYPDRHKLELRREDAEIAKSNLKSKARRSTQQGLGLGDPNQPGLFGTTSVGQERAKAKKEPTRQERKAARKAGAHESGTTKEPETLIQFSPEDIPYQLAYDAYRGISMVPEDRAKQTQQGYYAELKDIHDSILKKITPEQRGEAAAEIAGFKAEFIEHHKAILRAKSRTMSTMVTGASKFPTARNRKRLDAEQKKVEKYIEWKGKAVRRMKRNLGLIGGKVISSDDADATDQLSKKIADLEAKQDMMKRVNAAHRKFKKNPDSLEKSDLPDAIKKAVRNFEPDVLAKQPFPPYELTNNNANIRRLKQRAKDIEKSRQETGGDFEFDGGTITDSVEDNRLQIFFDEKPDAETRKSLKSNGFRWAPSVGAWQRMRGNHANWAAQRALGLDSELTFGSSATTPGTAARKPEGPMFSKRQGPVSRWHSQLKNFLSGKLPGKGKGRSLARTIDSWAKKGMIKSEELEWSGLTDWLRGQEKATKAEVLAWLDANHVEVREVEKGEATFVKIETRDGYDPAEGRDGLRSWDANTLRSALVNEEILSGQDVDGMSDEDIYRRVEEEEANGYSLVPEYYPPGTMVLGESRSTKFSQYQLPGGENYRELLLTLPGRPVQQYDVKFDEKTGEYYAVDKSGMEIARNQYHSDLISGINETEGDLYKSSHWDEPNVLAHIRFNERTGPNGERILFVEEVQSDWHQEGRKKGYGLTVDERKEYDSLLEARRQSGGQDSVFSETRARLQELDRKLSEGAFNAPFKKTWPLLAMKRMVRYAAENGFDSIAWTPGEVQAERYDLSKQVDEVVVDLRPNGTYDLSASVPDRGMQNIKDGVKPDELEEYVGKDLAEKILAKEHGHHFIFRGQDLKVGGEGMKGFYDKILPAAVNKFFGKQAWGGARVGTVEIGATGFDYQALDHKGLSLGTFKTKAEAEGMVDAYGKKDGAFGRVVEHPTGEGTASAWLLPITPQMRDKAMAEGMPLFRGRNTRRHGISKAGDIKKMVNRRIKNWKNAPPVQIIQKQDELPQGVKRFMKKGDIIDGVFWNGSVYLVADNLSTVSHATKILFHESFGHFGIRGLISSDPRTLGRYIEFEEALLKSHSKEIEAVADDYGFDLETLQGQALAVEEYLAREASKDESSGVINRLIRIISQWIRKTFPGLEVSRGEIKAWLADAKSYVTEGLGEAGGLEAQAAFSVAGHNTPADLVERLNQIHPDVDAFLSIKGDKITLSELQMPKAIRGQGLGSEFMKILAGYADENGMTIALTAAGDYGGSKAGQQRFYKRHGFVANRGRNKDYRISENMIRRPAFPKAQGYGTEPPMTSKRGAGDIPTQKTSKKPEGGVIYDGEGDTIRLYHGLPEGARRLDSGHIEGPAYFTPRKDMAAEYGTDGKKEAVVLELDVPVDELKIDFDLPGGRLLSVEEANSYSGNEGWDIYDYIDAGRSVGVEKSYVFDREKYESRPNRTPPPGEAGDPSFSKTAATPQAAKFAKQFDKDIEFFGNFISKKKDTSLVDRVFSVPLYHFKQIPALRGIFDTGLQWMNDKVKILRGLMYTPNGIARNAVMVSLKKKDHRGWKRWNRYVDQRDVDAIGYTVKAEKTEWVLYNPKGKKIESFHDEDKAHERAREMEGDDYFRKYGSREWADQLISYRIVTRNIFKQYRAGIERIIEKYRELGEEPPSVVYRTEEGNVEISLQTALAKMGDRQGYYRPRMRAHGRLTLIAKKKDENPIREHFDLGFMNDTKSKIKGLANYHTPIMRRSRKLKRKGYAVRIEKSDTMPEDVFLKIAGQRIAMNAVINKGLEGLSGDARVNLKDLGFQGRWVSRNSKRTQYKVNGEWLGEDMLSAEAKKDKNFWEEKRTKKDKGRHYEVAGAPVKPFYRDILKDLGGEYSYKQVYGKSGMPTWTFENAPEDIEEQIKELIYETTGVKQDLDMLFAAGLATQIANIEKSRGSLSRTIARNEAKGKDVWKGYEPDAIIALTQAAQGAAGGEAKRLFAERSVKLMTGTTETWQEYKDRMEAAGTKAIWGEYKKERDARRIDPTQQPNAYKDGMSYIENMLRNDEAADRILGIMKGLAVLKFLGFRVAAPAVNLTALATTVPATFKKNGIPIRSVPRYLGLAMKNYHSYRNGSSTGEWKQIFDTIVENGWHKAQYNREALSVLKSKAGQKFDTFMEWSMWMFGITEELNRLSTIAGAAKAFHERGMSLDEAILRAKEEVSDKAHGVYTKVNHPAAGRGGSVASQIFKSFYVFRTFSHNYLLNLKEMVGEKQYHAAAFMVISPAVLAGAGASVATPVIAAIGSAMGWDDPEEEFYRWTEETFGEDAGGYARFGMLYPAGVNLKGSLGIGITDIPTTFKDIFGAPGSVVSDLYGGVEAIVKGDTWKGVEKILPNAAASPMKAVREYNDGVTKKSGAPVFYGNEPLKATGLDAILRFFSFNPSTLSGKREKQWKEIKIYYGYSDDRNDIYAKYRRFYMLPPGERTRGRLMDIVADVETYNERARRAITYVPLITKRSIKANLRRSFRPSKRERMRR